MGPSSAKVEKAALGGEGSSRTEGRSRVEQSDRLIYYVRVLMLLRLTPLPFSYWLYTRKHRFR